jgi:ABC-type nickel/cobalt efflux system permease component RcnA
MEVLNSSLIIITATGLLAGTIHVFTGPDHLAAIGPFASNRPKKSWQIGWWWGMGHTGTVWLIGIIVFFFKELIPVNGLSIWGERLVGITLVALGIWGIQKAFRTKIHVHSHKHGGTNHTHVHVHNEHAAHDASRELNEQGQAAHQHKHAPFSIGVLHGFAGSSHLLAILPALALPGALNAVTYVFSFGVGTVLAMMLFSWIMGLLLQNYIKRFSATLKWIRRVLHSLQLESVSFG